MIELLTQENKSRIKVTEIFNHPWVVELEKNHIEQANKTLKKLNNLSSRDLLVKLISNNIR